MCLDKITHKHIPPVSAGRGYKVFQSFGDSSYHLPFYSCITDMYIGGVYEADTGMEIRAYQGIGESPSDEYYYSGFHVFEDETSAWEYAKYLGPRFTVVDVECYGITVSGKQEICTWDEAILHGYNAVHEVFVCDKMRLVRECNHS